MHRRIPRTLVAAAALALFAQARAGEPQQAVDPQQQARHADIRRLMVLTGAGELGVQSMREILTTLRPLVPQAPESFWREFAARIKPDDLVEMMVPIYSKYLSAADVKALIAFFESPAGRKLTSVQPLILKESMAVGQAWGGRVAEEVVRDARARGFQVKQL